MDQERRRLKGRRGDYLLLTQLVESDISTVHLGVRLGIQGLDRFVVFRQLRAHLSANQEAVDRFLQQARISARFRQPNLVQAFEAGKSKAGIFSVEEYLAGDGLGAVMACGMELGRPLPAALAAGVVAQACDGLGFVHSLADKQGRRLNLVHKNLNPRNLVVGPLGVVKLINLDIARSADRPHPSRQTGYLSPEQCLGEAVGPASDLFSLGVILWEALAKRHLFQRATDTQTRMAILAHEIPALSDLCPEGDAQLEAVALRALAKEPGQRFESADQMGAALRQVLTSQGAEAGPDAIASYLQAIMPERIAAKLEQLERVESSGQAPADPISLLPDSTVSLPAGVDALPAPPPPLPPPPVPGSNAFETLPVQPLRVSAPAALDNAAESNFDLPPTLEDVLQDGSDKSKALPDRPEVIEPGREVAAQAQAAGAALEEVLGVEPERDRSDAGPAEAGSSTLDEVLGEPTKLPPVRVRLAESVEPAGSASPQDQAPMEAALRMRPTNRWMVPGVIGGAALAVLLLILVLWPSSEAPLTEDGPAEVGEAAPEEDPPGAGEGVPATQAAAPGPIELAILQIHTDPVGCRAYLGDLPLNGKTPLDNVIVPARRELSVAVVCRGFQRESQDIAIEPGETAKLDFYPQPLK